MKTIIPYSFLLPALIMIFSACSKDPAAPAADTRFPLPLVLKDTTGDDYISGKEPEGFVGKYKVGMYYGTDVVAQKIDVVVIKNDDKTNVKTIQSGVTIFPATIQVTGTQLTTLFDSTIQLGDKFEIGVDVTTKDGQKFVAFPATGNPYNADTTALPGSSFSVAYVTDCIFDVADFDGNYTVVSDTWDYKAGDLIAVKPGTGNKILITAWPNPDVGNFTRWPMSIDVDPVTYAVTIPMQGVGEFAGGASHIIDAGTGTVSPCGDKITLTVAMFAGPSYVEVPLVLRK